MTNLLQSSISIWLGDNSLDLLGGGGDPRARTPRGQDQHVVGAQVGAAEPAALEQRHRRADLLVEVLPHVAEVGGAHALTRDERDARAVEEGEVLSAEIRRLEVGSTAPLDRQHARASLSS